MNTRYFERVVEKRANNMLKHKRLYAWLFLFAAVAKLLEVILAVKKIWDTDWSYAWSLYRKEQRKKKKQKQKQDTDCPYKVETTDAV